MMLKMVFELLKLAKFALMKLFLILLFDQWVPGPRINGWSYGEAIGAWFFDKPGPTPRFLYDDCSGDLPCNSECANHNCQDS